MNEELLKRNTDCVYFLASPLTCKKGFECEYRHSEIARLNPRECWYWLSGSCLNPACAFRHPPLDGHNGETLESAAPAPAPAPAPSSVPVNKTYVPCYYYFNGYCNKGDRCSFMHDMDSEPPPQGNKQVKTSAISEALHLENNTLAGADLGWETTNGHLNPLAAAMAEDDAKDQHKEYFEIPAVSKDVPRRSSLLVSEDEEALLPAAGFVNHISYAIENHSSEDEVYNQIDEEEIYPDGIDREIKREERWESSPGFDVLVDGEADNSDSEDGREEYITALDEKRRELNGGYFSGYDFRSSVEYDPSNPDMECYYASEVYGQHEDDDRSRVKMLDSISTHERYLTSVGLGFDDRKRSDLRYRLSRQRFIDNHSFSGLSRVHESSRLIGKRIQGQPWQCGHHRQRHKRPTSEGRSTVESLVKNGIFANGGLRNDFPRHSKQFLSNKKKQREKAKKHAKRRRLLSEVVSREMRPTCEPTAFSGPKTLAQIREEKKGKAQEHGDFTGRKGHYGKTTSSTTTDFKAPRPLSEILRDKGKL